MLVKLFKFVVIGGKYHTISICNESLDVDESLSYFINDVTCAVNGTLHFKIENSLDTLVIICQKEKEVQIKSNHMHIWLRNSSNSAHSEVLVL